MERRVFIAVFLSFLVLYGYQALFVPPPPPATPRRRRRQRHRRGTPAAATPPAPPAAVARSHPRRRRRAAAARRRRRRGARDRRRDRHRRRRRSHEPRRPRRPLAAEGLPRRARASRSISCRPALPRRSADAVLAARGRRGDHAAAEHRAVRVTGDTERPRRCDDAAARRWSSSSRTRGAARAQGVPLRSRRTTSSRSRRRSTQRRQRAESGGASGAPASATSARASGGGSFFTGNYVQPPQAIFHRDGNVERLAGDNARRAAGARGAVSIRRHRRSLLPRRGGRIRARRASSSSR